MSEKDFVVVVNKMQVVVLLPLCVSASIIIIARSFTFTCEIALFSLSWLPIHTFYLLCISIYLLSSLSFLSFFLLIFIYSFVPPPFLSTPLFLFFLPFLLTPSLLFFSSAFFSFTSPSSSFLRSSSFLLPFLPPFSFASLSPYSLYSVTCVCVSVAATS